MIPADIKIPGALGFLYDHYMRTSYPAQPEYGLAAALSFGALVCSRSYFYPQRYGGSSTNLYLLVIGEAGTGKEGVKTCLNQALAETDILDWVDSGGWTSPGGLALSLKDSPNLLGVAEEFAHFMQAAGAERGDPNTIALIASLLEMYSIKGWWAPRKYSKQNRADFAFKVNRPTVSLIGLSTEERLGRYLSEDNISDGLLPRFLVFRGPNSRESVPYIGDRGDYEEPEFPRQVSDWARQVRAPDNSEFSRERLMGMKFRAPDREASDQFRALHQKTLACDSKMAQTLHARAVENAMRLALIISLSIDPFNQDAPITGEAAQVAIDLITMSMDNAEYLATHMGGRSDWLKAQDKIEAFIRECGSVGVTYRELSLNCRAFKNLQGKKIKEQILADLVDCGAVTRQNLKKGGWEVILLRHSQFSA